MHTLITGSDGFIGQHLISTLLDKKHSVSTLSRKDKKEKNTKHYIGDITDKNNLQIILKKDNPDIIFHLAAQSNIPLSFQKPVQTSRTNVEGTLNFLEILKELHSQIVFLSVGSSAEYGRTAAKDHHLSENVPLEPSSPYGISKLTQAKYVQLYRQAFGLNSIHVRPFAVIGPGMATNAISDFARRIVQIEKGELDILEVGDISTVRDFIDVRDCTQAMELIRSKGTEDIYNICLGKGKTLEEVLEMMISFSTSKIAVKRIDKTRPADDHTLVGDPSRLFSLDFKPAFALKDTVSDTLNYWRMPRNLL